MGKSKHHMYINGFIPSTARKVAEFVFGKYFIKLEPDEERRIFVTYVDNEINDKELCRETEDHFKCFDIKLVSVDDVKEESKESEEESI